MLTLAYYDASGEQVRETKRKVLAFLIGAKRAGKLIAGYGRAGEGQYAAQLLRHPHGLHRLHGGS